MDPALAVHSALAVQSVDGFPVVGRFRQSSDDTRRSRAKVVVRNALNLLPPPARRPLLSAAAQIPASTSQATIEGRAFGVELSGLIAAERLTSADHVFVHTLRDGELLGLLNALGGSPSLPHIHALLRYDATPATRSVASRAEATAYLGGRLRVWTDTEPLAAQYRGVGLDVAGVLPIPHCLPVLSERPQATGPLTISYLGGARGEKGFARLPSLLESLAEPYLNAGRVKFVVQANYSLSREEPLMAKTARALSRMPGQWLELLPRPLTPVELQARLVSSDILLLPYDGESYRRRSSGLLVQAAVAGIPVVVPVDTWLSAAAPPGAHVVFDQGVPSLVEAVRQAVERHPSLLAAARGARDRYRHEHDAERLVAKLTACGEGLGVCV
jgi:glycosyltransferase involved in cell wall biosynthesis